jgi:hypothetical protein
MKLYVQQLKQLLELHFHNDLKQNEYYIKNIKANQLLTWNRFDLAFKLLYLEMKDYDMKFSKDIYKEHIRAFSLGKFTEPGNENKNSIDKFIDEFNKTFENIKQNGFDKNKTLIPLSKNGSIANGAHRVASAIYLDKNVDCVQIDSSDHIYDYNFFYTRNVSRDILDMVATKFVEHASNIHIAFLWPIGINKDKEVKEIFKNIVYEKKIKLNANGAHNLLSQIYYGEKWLGDVKNHFSGANAKLVECFKTFDEFSVIVFEANNLDEVLKIKDNIRDVFGAGKHSIHITDTKEEAIRVARVVFNDNGLHFLNFAKPTKYISTYNKVAQFKKFIFENNLDVEDVIIDSSMILSVYGIREAKNIYFLSKKDINVKFEDINLHNEELKYYKMDLEDIIYDSRNYFCFEDLKFISFDLLYEMKKNRDEIKDRNDCKMMETFIESNIFKDIPNRIKQHLYYSKIKLKIKILEILKKIGLYDIVKKLYRGLKYAK